MSYHLDHSSKLLTTGQLHPSTHMKHRRRFTKEEHQHGADSQKGGNYGKSNQHRRRKKPYACTRNCNNILQFTPTLFTCRLHRTRGKQTQFPRSVSYPLRCGKCSHHYDRVTHGKYGPKDPNGFWITSITCGVNVRGVHVFDLRAHYGDYRLQHKTLQWTVNTDCWPHRTERDNIRLLLRRPPLQNV